VAETASQAVARSGGQSKCWVSAIVCALTLICLEMRSHRTRKSTWLKRHAGQHNAQPSSSPGLTGEAA